MANKTESINYTLRIPTETRATLQRIAAEQGRSLSNLIQWFLRKGIEEHERSKQKE